MKATIQFTLEEVQTILIEHCKNLGYNPQFVNAIKEEFDRITGFEVTILPNLPQ